MKNNCNIIKDLLPLYAEDMLSEDSRELVEEHLGGCEDCRAELEKIKDCPQESEIPDSVPGFKSSLKKLRGRIEILTAMIIIFGSVIGVSLIHHSSILYNIVIMPIIGALGYVIMKWRALYNIPIILVLSTVFEMLLTFETDYWVRYFGMLIYYIPAAFVGIIIAALYAFAFRKEDKR